MFLAVALVALVFVDQAEAGGKGKGGGDDIILYNGNIVLRGGGGGKGKGKGNGGSIVIANSHHGVDVMPMYGHHWGGEGFGHKRR